MAAIADHYASEGPSRVAVEYLIRQAGLCRLVTETAGSPNVRIALIDGFVCTTHPLFCDAEIHQITRVYPTAGSASEHATLLASTLVGTRGLALGLCSGCTLISIPVVTGAFASGEMAAMEAAARVARGIREALNQGADVLQLSIAFDPEQGRALEPVISALTAAAARGIVAVVAAGNSTHLAPNPAAIAPGVVAVVAADRTGAPLSMGVLEPSIRQHSLFAPGFQVPGAIPPSSIGWSTGSSVAACFVTGTFALLRSQFPSHSSAEILGALLHRYIPVAGRSVVPARLNGDVSAAMLSSQVKTRNLYDNSFQRSTVTFQYCDG